MNENLVSLSHPAPHHRCPVVDVHRKRSSRSLPISAINCVDGGWGSRSGMLSGMGAPLGSVCSDLSLDNCQGNLTEFTT